ncbi:hypothetical protein HaLaN_05103 [Haematococcus lacustris]|uniref:Uncharacterized protein n=1 Tax=Haematococcus lacustris TaxID=44745 RepID=A0A699YQ36_HAELA|nr:hypothetical protein HaLaN_05103 [Haematococcus lacustris]
MREQHQQELATYQKQLDLLRTRVSEIVSRLLNNSVSKADAADIISALGCHVTYLESDVAAPEVSPFAALPEEVQAKHPEWGSQTQPQLVMEDRQRLQRLVASGMLRTGGSQALPYRIPLVTFPSMRQPSSGGSIASKPSFTNPTSDKENQPKPCLPAGDVNTKDQAPASSASAARSKTAPHISLAHTKQFEYSVQTQPQLVMEDRQRLQRLVASGMLRTGGSQALPYRIPLVTFPSMRQPSSGGSIASKPSFTNPTSDKENQPKPCLPAGDVNTKDQAPASSASAARSKTAPHISLAHTKQFEYSVQGKQGSQYIARVPLTASQPSGLALLASGGLASALHWAPEAAAQGLGPQPDMWCSRAVLVDPLESLDQQLVSRQ